MSVTRLVRILGGLPAFATVDFSYDAYSMEHDAEVTELYWYTSTGSVGRPLPRSMFERALTYGNDYQGCNIIEQVQDCLGFEDWERRELQHAAGAYQRGWVPEPYIIHSGCGNPW